jgi:hypothetical protein
MAKRDSGLNPFNLPETIDSHDGVMAAFNKATTMMDADPELAARAQITKSGNPITIRRIKGADRWTADLIAGVSAAKDKYLDGVQNPRKNPKEEALKKKGRWKNKIEESIKNDSYAKGIAGYNLDEAIELAVSIGADNLVRGVEARAPKIQRVVTKLVPLFTAAKDVLDRMPTDTVAETEKKQIEASRLMREIGKKMKGA